MINSKFQLLELFLFVICEKCEKLFIFLSAEKLKSWLWKLSQMFLNYSSA